MPAGSAVLTHSPAAAVLDSVNPPNSIFITIPILFHLFPSYIFLMGKNSYRLFSGKNLVSNSHSLRSKLRDQFVKPVPNKKLFRKQNAFFI